MASSPTLRAALLSFRKRAPDSTHTHTSVLHCLPACCGGRRCSITLIPPLVYKNGLTPHPLMDVDNILQIHMSKVHMSKVRISNLLPQEFLTKAPWQSGVQLHGVRLERRRLGWPAGRDRARSAIIIRVRPPVYNYDRTERTGIREHIPIHAESKDSGFPPLRKLYAT